MIEQVRISDLDCVYLSYDEPQKEKFWALIKNMVPWAKRVDGVKGSDAAHKAAAAASTTERFILIDGDNLPDSDFFNQKLELTETNSDCVFRWKAKNYVNGLTYGNGGISCWTRAFINNMRTHENTDGSDETVVEFCFDFRYLAMHNCYSVTYPNGSAFHAWRAGFREGVKMCLDRGRKPGIEEFKSMRGWYNLETLNVWHSIGADVEFGRWATFGARLGTYMCMLDPNWNYIEVQDFEKLKDIFQSVNRLTLEERKDRWRDITDQIKRKLELPCIDMGPEQSAFWKKYYAKIHNNKGIMDPA